MNRIFRGGSNVPRPRTITDKTVAGAYLPGTAIFIGATQFTQATAASGGRLAILGDRDYYGLSSNAFSQTSPLYTAYMQGESGVAYLPKPDDEFTVAMGAGTYTFGHELTVGAAGRFVAAASGDIVVAHLDQPGMGMLAGLLADVVIANFYRKT